MRRALLGVVPREILNRKRKAFTVRRFMTMYQEAWPTLQDYFRGSLSQELRYVDENEFLQTLAATKHGQLSNLTQLKRTISLELWLRMLTARKLVANPMVIGKEIETGQIVRQVAVSSSDVGERYIRC
jgi:asparagine synthase (glutamine-hydrolysing)